MYTLFVSTFQSTKSVLSRTSDHEINEFNRINVTYSWQNIIVIAVTRTITRSKFQMNSLH